MDELRAPRSEGIPLPGRAASPPFPHPSVSGLANHRVCAECPWAPPTHSPVPTREAQCGARPAPAARRGCRPGLQQGPRRLGGLAPAAPSPVPAASPFSQGCCVSVVLRMYFSLSSAGKWRPLRGRGVPVTASVATGKVLLPLAGVAPAPCCAAGTSALPPTRRRGAAAGRCSSKRKEHVLLKIYLPR